MISTPQPATSDPGKPRPLHIGCVSYLNAKPLIEGLVGLPDPVVRFAVPSHLLDDLQSGQVDIALCPVIDYFRSANELEIVPVGGICCRGKTLTVRLFSQVPLDRVASVHTDVDSHTSVALLRVLMAQRLGLHPRVVGYDARRQRQGQVPANQPETILLIGDKVVTNSPPHETYPFQIDLGESWLALTGMPFVFAVWMTRAGTDLGDVPARLEERREINSRLIPQIVARHAGAHGWPEDLAKEYLGGLLSYRVGSEELKAIEKFAESAWRLGLIDEKKPLRMWKPKSKVQSQGSVI